MELADTVTALLPSVLEVGHEGLEGRRAQPGRARRTRPIAWGTRDAHQLPHGLPVDAELPRDRTQGLASCPEFACLLPATHPLRSGHQLSLSPGTSWPRWSRWHGDAGFRLNLARHDLDPPLPTPHDVIERGADVLAQVESVSNLRCYSTPSFKQRKCIARWAPRRRPRRSSRLLVVRTM